MNSLSLFHPAELHPDIAKKLLLPEGTPPLMCKEQQRDIDFRHTPPEFLAEFVKGHLPVNLKEGQAPFKNDR
jgi:hypothetical protein